MKESKFIKGIVATVAVVTFSVPAIASADDVIELQGRSEKVVFADLNIEKAEGAQQLYRRLQHASKRVCGVETLTKSGTVRDRSQSMRCFRSTLNAAVAKVGSDTLTAVHEG